MPVETLFYLLLISYFHFESCLRLSLGALTSCKKPIPIYPYTEQLVRTFSLKAANTFKESNSLIFGSRDSNRENLQACVPKKN